jgi:ribulose-5-phosphate 4-epimerase/fuculose-1-phosphate aldolase
VPDHATLLVQAGAALARSCLVTAFGHVSARTGPDSFVISPPVPLSRFGAGDVMSVSLADAELPPGVPKEAWIHREVYASRPEVQAVCRAQPKVTTALGSAGVTIRPLHGQGSFLGDCVPVHPDSRLVRDQQTGRALARSLRGDAVIMRGNGAVTVGPTVAEAVALMWVLEASAELNAAATAAGTPTPLPPDEQEAWRAVAPELLTRIWHYLIDKEHSL